ncbi:hypothetical protein, partial [Escherichia coli]|uniref:hypothetical protein n=1 Tax=Escherichia coli TaxID=562 RepID=UPI0021B3A832
VLNKTGPQSIHILRGVRQQQDEPGRFSICSRQAAVVLAVICCHDPDRSSILIKISSRQRLFCKYPLKRAVSHSERFFRFRMFSPWLYRTKRQKAIQGFSVKDPKRINQRIV